MSAAKKIKLVQTGSAYGQKPGVKETLIGLGLGRTNQKSELGDTPSVRGMITKVRHLVTVEEAKGK